MTELQKEQIVAVDSGQVTVLHGLGANTGPNGDGIRFEWNLYSQGPEPDPAYGTHTPETYQSFLLWNNDLFKSVTVRK